MIMRRRRAVRLMWGARMARGRENARLRRAMEAGQEIRPATLARIGRCCPSRMGFRAESQP